MRAERILKTDKKFFSIGNKELFVFSGIRIGNLFGIKGQKNRKAEIFTSEKN